MLPPTATQTEIDFSRPTAAPPPATGDEVSALVAYLTGKGWVTARDIIADAPPTLRLPEKIDAAQRKLRTMAEAGRDVVLSYPGSPGYRVLREATVEEIEHGIRAHGSQARLHLRRKLSLQRFKHRRVG